MSARSLKLAALALFAPTLVFPLLPLQAAAFSVVLLAVAVTV